MFIVPVFDVTVPFSLNIPRELSPETFIILLLVIFPLFVYIPIDDFPCRSIVPLFSIFTCRTASYELSSAKAA